MVNVVLPSVVGGPPYLPVSSGPPSLLGTHDEYGTRAVHCGALHGYLCTPLCTIMHAVIKL